MLFSSATGLAALEEVIYHTEVYDMTNRASVGKRLTVIHSNVLSGLDR